MGESGFPEGAVGSVTLQYPSYSEINHSQLLEDSKQASELSFVSAFLFWAVQSNLAVNKSVLYFIQAGDPILTYYPRWSVVSLLRQPAAVGAGGFCAESNPAGGSGAGVHQPGAVLELGLLTRPSHSSCFKASWRGRAQPALASSGTWPVAAPRSQPWMLPLTTTSES